MAVTIVTEKTFDFAIVSRKPKILRLVKNACNRAKNGDRFASSYIRGLAAYEGRPGGDPEIRMELLRFSRLTRI